MKKIYILLGGVIILLFGIVFFRNDFIPSKDEIHKQENHSDKEQQVDASDNKTYRTIKFQRTSNLILEEDDGLIQVYYKDDFEFYILNQSEDIKNMGEGIIYDPDKGMDLTINDTVVKINGDYQNTSTQWLLTLENVNYGGQTYEELDIHFIKTAGLMSYIYLVEGHETVPAGQFYYLNDQPKDFLFKFVADSDKYRDVPYLPQVDRESVEEAISTQLFRSQCQFLFEWEDDYILKVKCYDWQFSDAGNSEKFFGDMTLGKDAFGEAINLSYFACRIGKQSQVYAMDLYDLGVRKLDIAYDEDRLWDLPEMRSEQIISFTTANGAQGYHFDVTDLYYDLETMKTLEIQDGESYPYMAIEDYPFAELYNQEIFFIPETIGSYESSYHKGGCIYNLQGEILVRDSQLEGFQKLENNHLIVFYRTGQEENYEKIQLIVFNSMTDEVYQYQTNFRYIPNGIGVRKPYISASNKPDWLYIVNTFTTSENYNYAPLGFMFNYKTGEVAEIKGNLKGDWVLLEDGILIYKESYGDDLYQVIDLKEQKDITQAVNLKNTSDPIIISEGYISWTYDGKILIYDLTSQIKREIAFDGYPRLLGIANGKTYFYQE